MTVQRDRLRIAVQKSGRLSDASLVLLERAGLSFRSSRDRLFLYGESMPVDVLLVRDDDIPGLLAEGSCELGIVGRNILDECARISNVSPPTVRAALGFGACRLSIAVPRDAEYSGPGSLDGQRIATSYPGLLAEWIARQGIRADIVVLNGSVEIAPRLGKAEAVCDLVSSGATLAANQLREVETVLESQAVLAVTPNELSPLLTRHLEHLCARIEGVQSGRGARLLMMQAPRSALAAIQRLLPSSQSTSVSLLEGEGDDIAVQALCTDPLGWQHLEQLKLLGARRLIVLNVEQMLA